MFIWGYVLSLEVFFSAKSVAVIGASEKVGTLGRALMSNLLEKYKGKIYPINIKYDKVFGLKCYKSILEVPGTVELVVIAVPAHVVPKVIDECGRKGVKGAIIISAGFREVGPEGAKREEEVVRIAKKYGLRIVGPNCLGIYDAHTGLDTIFNPSDRQGKPPPGDVAFISQSGALGAALLDWVRLFICLYMVLYERSSVHLLFSRSVGFHPSLRERLGETLGSPTSPSMHEGICSSLQ